jgi:hypothetical protein
LASILRIAETTLVGIAVGQFVCKFGGLLLLQLLQLADFGFWLGLSLGYGVDSLISSCYSCFGALSLEKGAPPLFGNPV